MDREKWLGTKQELMEINVKKSCGNMWEERKDAVENERTNTNMWLEN